MKQNIGYQIDYVEGKIFVSKKFLKEASDVTTTAYSDLVQIRKDYPDFTIEPRQIAKKDNKMTYGKLTYDFMEKYLPSYSLMEDIIMRSSIEYPIVEEGLKEFGEIRDLARLTGKGYHMVRRWFLEKYPPIYSEKGYRVA